MKLTDAAVQDTIRKLLKNEDHRLAVGMLIHTTFMQYTRDFFERVVAAKLRHQDVTADWYRQEFLNDSLLSDELIINAGLNDKTITNRYGSRRRSVVLEATVEHYEQTLAYINTISAESEDLDFQLTIKFRGVSVDLTMSESLIVINSLAAKHSQIRGGAWSTAGKSVEHPLMLTLCKLFSVADNHYALRGLSDAKREVDFFLIDAAGQKYRCEVKLMGRGNPESADAFIARDSQIFVADRLSDLNKTQLSARGVYWVALNDPNGYRKFLDILHQLGIPARDFDGDLDARLNIIFNAIF